MISDNWYILRSINRHKYIEISLHSANISTLLKALQKDSKTDSDEQTLSSHSFRELLEHGDPLERIMLKGVWQMDSTAKKHLRN